MVSPNAELVYPANLGINIASANGALTIGFPRPHMACLVSV